LRAPHRSFPFFIGLCYEDQRKAYQADAEVRDRNTIFCIGKHHRFLVTRDLVIAVYRARGKWNSRAVLSSRTKSPLHLSKEWICTRSRSIYRENNGWGNKIFPQLRMSIWFNESMQWCRSLPSISYDLNLDQSNCLRFYPFW